MRVLIRGAGDLASGIGWRLHRCGFQVAMTDLERPTAVRWMAAFCPALWLGAWTVEGVTARRCADLPQAVAAWGAGEIPVFADPDGTCRSLLKPDVVVDAILAKRNLGTAITDALLVIGIGPGFCAGEDCHMVIETKRGHTLGRVIETGTAIPNTGVPGDIGGYTVERVLRTPCGGDFVPLREIGDAVRAGETLATVAGQPVRTEISGVLRGILPAGTRVPGPGFKAGDVDPRGNREHCFTISDKALSVAGGVLEAILRTQAEEHRKH
ncbi:MAG: EF2563 family selenium-dependent molybdenum hydroxylase system protein [Oscillospiraceae bacterium]|nr:EF2563 family selenium-dependent molybdenum hydroxylase system protein [Oscillospiraceae bacterium]